MPENGINQKRLARAVILNMDAHPFRRKRDHHRRVSNYPPRREDLVRFGRGRLLAVGQSRVEPGQPEGEVDGVHRLLVVKASSQSEKLAVPGDDLSRKRILEDIAHAYAIVEYT